MKLFYSSETNQFWLFKGDKLICEGGCLQVIDFIKKNDVMSVADFSEACAALEDKGHEIANFGLFGGFLFTEKFKAA